ncbi:MAG: outer membrane protein transport protein [Pseudomonadota bacterium]
MVSHQSAFALRALTFSMLCLAAGHTFAGGLDLPSITASHQGTSNANAAEANDPSVLYYNPAGLAQLKGGLQVSQGFSVLILNGKVEADRNETRHGASDATQKSDEGDPIGNDTATNGKAGTFWPAVLAAGGAFVSLPIDDMVTAGIGIFAPGGGNLNFKSNWAGAYQIDSIAIELININPSIGIRFDDKHSVGFGVSVIGGHIRQKTQIDIEGVKPFLLKSAVDSGAVDVGGIPLLSTLLSPCGTNPISAACIAGYNVAGDALVAEGSNGSAQVEMYGYGLGFNAGYMFNFNENTRAGLAYRSESTIKLRGTLEWDLDDVKGTPLFNNVIGPATGGYSGDDALKMFLQDTLRPDTKTKGDLILPARTSANIFHKLNDKIDVMADFTFIETSAVDKIRVQFLDVQKNGKTIKQGAGGIDTKWRDSFKVSLGGNYHYDDKLTLKSGFQYDKTPVPSAEFRHPGAPDSDRYMFSFGANYKVKRNLTLDAAYSVTFLEDSESNYTDRCRTTNRDDEDGTYNPNGESCTGNGGKFSGRFSDTSIQTLGIQMNQKF